jgi:hypothetical protein
MRFLAVFLALGVFGAASRLANSAEPNETFATSTVLSPGVLMTVDELTPGQVSIPDTLLGIRNMSGQITQTDDNGSLIGSGTASGIVGAPTNMSSLAFSVTGSGDAQFTGAHAQSGQYEVFVDVFSSDGAPVASLNEIRTLQAGLVNSFSFTGTDDWIGGTYDVNIDNLINEPTGGDVDFFTFTGLAPGATFRAETSDPMSDLNTFLYWYNAAGAVIGIDDNSGPGSFSRLDGVVPENGQLTFAVTGFGDIVNGMPAGEHTEDGSYQLAILTTPAFSADFNDSGAVDDADLGIWSSSFGQSAGADADLDADSDGADFLVWQRQLGSGSAGQAAASVPEPPAWTLFVVACVLGRMALPCRPRS